MPRDVAALVPTLDTTAPRVLCARFMDDVITQIERAMEARGMGPVALANALGYRSHTGISRMLARKHEPGEALLEDVATALGVELVIPPTPERRIKPRETV